VLEKTYCHGQVASIIQQSQSLLYTQCQAKPFPGSILNNGVNGLRSRAHMLKVTLSSSLKETSAPDRSVPMVSRAGTPPGKFLLNRGIHL